MKNATYTLRAWIERRRARRLAKVGELVNMGIAPDAARRIV